MGKLNHQTKFTLSSVPSWPKSVSSRDSTDPLITSDRIPVEYDLCSPSKQPRFSHYNCSSSLGLSACFQWRLSVFRRTVFDLFLGSPHIGSSFESWSSHVFPLLVLFFNAISFTHVRSDSHSTKADYRISTVTNRVFTYHLIVASSSL